MSAGRTCTEAKVSEWTWEDRTSRAGCCADLAKTTGKLLPARSVSARTALVLIRPR